MSARGSVYAWCGCRDQVTGRRLGGRCPRRGQRGHGSWYLLLEIPAGADGARRRVRRGGYPTREAARRALSQLVMPAPGVREAAPVTVGQWLQRWLGQRAGARESTRRGYASHVRLYLAPYSGVDVGADRRVAGDRDPAGRGGVDRRADRGVPERGPRPPAVRGVSPDRAARPAPRRGLGAALADLDLETGTAVICGQLQQYDGHLTVAPPKTPHSERVIALDRITVAALRRHRGVQRAERAHAAGPYHDSGYVFTGLNGDPLAPDRLSRIFKMLAEEAGLPPIRPHDLRHGAASLALSAGTDLKVVQDMLGHSSIVLTADTYTSVLPDLARKAAEDTASLIIEAGCLVPGTSRRRRPAPRQPRQSRRRALVSASSR
jgi:hypothetical protein